MDKLIRTLLRFFTHPIVVFVLLQLVCIAITVIWVVWFVNQDQALRELSDSLAAANVERNYGLGLLIAGCILLGVVIVGVIILFVEAQRQIIFNRQQQNFVSSVTHELRSPLASLQLAVDTMRARELSAEVQSQLYQVIESDIARLKKLIDQILVSAKLDSGIVNLQNRQAINAQELIAEVVDNLVYADGHLRERVTINCASDLSLFSTREGLVLILSNLIENAVKYSPVESQIEVNVSANVEEIKFAVVDHGFGLQPRELKKVFKMFYRADVTTERAIAGTGLGLYIVKTLATALGGQINAESKGHGLGSTFSFKIPVSQPV
jgi:signal transduction histidine kinase